MHVGRTWGRERLCLGFCWDFTCSRFWCFWGYRENLQGVSVECSVTSFLTFTFVIKTDIMSVSRECVGLYAARAAELNIFSCKHPPHTYFFINIGAHEWLSLLHPHTHTHTQTLSIHGRFWLKKSIQTVSKNGFHNSYLNSLLVCLNGTF